MTTTEEAWQAWQASKGFTFDKEAEPLSDEPSPTEHDLECIHCSWTDCDRCNRRVNRVTAKLKQELAEKDKEINVSEDCWIPYIKRIQKLEKELAEKDKEIAIVKELKHKQEITCEVTARAIVELKQQLAATERNLTIFRELASSKDKQLAEKDKEITALKEEIRQDNLYINDSIKQDINNRGEQ